MVAEEQKKKITIIRGLDLASIKEGESEICPLCHKWIHSGKVFPDDCCCSVGVIENHFNLIAKALQKSLEIA